MIPFRSLLVRTSLLTRTNAVLALSSLAIAATALWSFDRFVTTPISVRSATDEAALLVLAAQMWVELEESRRPDLELALLVNHDLILSGDVRELPVLEEQDEYFDMLRAEIEARVGPAVEIMEADGLLWVNIPTISRTVLQIGFSSQRGEVQPFSVGIVILVIGSAIVFGTSFYIVQRVARPLVRASETAQAFRGAGEFEPLPEEGPRELVALASSFNEMARDITALITNRTTLLAGISHDLRTPLARMRLAVELLPDDVDPALVERFERNLQEMDDLIGDALRFARGTQESAVAMEIVRLVRSIVGQIDPCIEITADPDAEAAVLSLPRGAFARVVSNLVNNARRHAEGATVGVEMTDDVVEIHVRDRGPGIPEEERERVFRPFYRLDRSRSSATGGSGLGLAIVLQLCQAHGWRVDLRNVPGGGNDACLTLPR